MSFKIVCWVTSAFTYSGAPTSARTARAPLPFVPADLRDFAEAILQGDTVNDATLRTAVSRAYYGAFLTARSVLEARIGRRIGPGAEHRRVQRELRDVSLFLGQELDRLRTARNSADYDLESEWTVNGVIKLVATSRAILDGLEGLVDL